jgi:hypothetical protein
MRIPAIKYFLFALVVLVFERQCGSQQTPQNEGPNLDDTITFLNKMVSLEDSFVTTVNHCELYITRNRIYHFAIPQGTIAKGKDQYGIPRYSTKWMFVEEPGQVWRFNLKSIDPSSVNSKGVWSIQYLKQHEADSDDTNILKEPDLTLVTFETSGSEKLIELGKFQHFQDGRSPTPLFDQKASMGMLIFDSKNRAEKFVTAFVHAANLCGGKGVDFAPTPSKQ